jgi:hypothetical protein
VIPLEFAIVGLIFVGASAAMVWAIVLRHEAVQEWRKSIGGTFDGRQRKFATYLDLDRARLPPAALKKLAESQRALLAGSLVGLVALGLLQWVTFSHA